MKKNSRKFIIAIIIVLLVVFWLTIVLIPAVINSVIEDIAWEKTIEYGQKYQNEITTVAKSISEFQHCNVNTENSEEFINRFNIVFDELDCCIVYNEKQVYDGEVELKRCAHNGHVYGYLYFPEKISEYERWGYRVEKISENLYAYHYVFLGV